MLADNGDIRISVVIPTFNYARFLPQAIESVLNQTAHPFEILVADDGSTDNTLEVVRSYTNKVVYIYFDHCGVYSVRQKMLQQIEGNWFLNLDADNWLDPDFLNQMICTVKENAKDKTFAFAYPDMELHGDRTGRVTRPEFTLHRLKNGNFIDMNSVINTVVAKRYGFDSNFNSGQGDYDFFLTLAKSGYRGVRAGKAVLNYRVHEGSISSNVRRKRQQREIMRKIVYKHRGLYTPEDAKNALAAADNRAMVALISSRSPYEGIGKRFSDWLLFARIGWRHAEFISQSLYLIFPRVFFKKFGKYSDVFFLYRDTGERRTLVRKVFGGGTVDSDCSQLFSLEKLYSQNIAVDCNLRCPREDTLLQMAWVLVDKFFAPSDGLGWGDLYSVWCHCGPIANTKVVFATSDNTGLPASRFKQWGIFKKSLVYVSIGLPERLQALGQNNPKRLERYKKRMAFVDRFIAYGHAETKWLQSWLGDSDKVCFVPFGVDTSQWSPGDKDESGADIISVGADSKRDFQLLIEYAKKHPDRKICIVTTREWAKSFGVIPSNIQLKLQIPIQEVKELIEVSKLVVLPVQENTYSGATTTLLQCMSMAKAVAVTKVGAIEEGYGFKDYFNLRWLEPGSLQNLEYVVEDLLADRPQRMKLGQAAREHVVATLGWERYAGHIQSVIKEAEEAFLASCSKGAPSTSEREL